MEHHKGESLNLPLGGVKASNSVFSETDVKTKPKGFNDQTYKVKSPKKQTAKSTHAQGKTGRKRPSERNFLNDKRRKEIANKCHKALAESDYVPAKSPQYKNLRPYDHLCSIFTDAWKQGQLVSSINRGTIKAGKNVGLNHPEKFDGYQKVSIWDESWLAHRIIFKLANGRDPVGQLDHIDGDRTNNYPSNLREVTPQENARNRHAVLSNTGRLGVSWCKKAKRYSADIKFGGKGIKLGKFIRLEDAVEARKIGESIIFAEPSKLEVLA
ncbi:MAG: HNH endonuclease signature motif containing protein [Pseudomonadota bacterium]